MGGLTTNLPAPGGAPPAPEALGSLFSTCSLRHAQVCKASALKHGRELAGGAPGGATGWGSRGLGGQRAGGAAGWEGSRLGELQAGEAGLGEQRARRAAGWESCESCRLGEQQPGGGRLRSTVGAGHPLPCLPRLGNSTPADPAWTEVFNVLSVATIKFEMLSTAPQNQVSPGA